MSVYAEKIDWLPKISKEFYLTWDEIQSNLKSLLPESFRERFKEYPYSAWLAQPELQDFLTPYIDGKILVGEVAYQVATGDLPPHIDINPNDYRLVYCYDQGSDEKPVVTSWYDEEGNILHNEILESEMWYNIAIKTRHGVKNITTPRLSICIASNLVINQ